MYPQSLDLMDYKRFQDLFPIQPHIGYHMPHVRPEILHHYLLYLELNEFLHELKLLHNIRDLNHHQL
ncbi:MAG: hypothetical protein PQJ46_14965 [Spirochaetales bacterium]|nr:hypothetical protein [Spirochaetales bacterium]